MKIALSYQMPTGFVVLTEYHYLPFGHASESVLAEAARKLAAASLDARKVKYTNVEVYTLATKI